MSIDYKTYQTRDGRKLRSWQWLFLGCFLGLGLSFLLTLENSWKEQWNALEIKSFWKETKQHWAKKPKTFLPKKQAVLEETRFDFYNVLPEMEVVIPLPKQKISTPITSAQDSSSASLENLGDLPSNALVPITPVYILQVGAFKSRAEAERLKVELALTGLQAGIETSTMPNGATWYRVKLGPYASETVVDRDKQHLQKQGIQSFKVIIER